MASHRAMVTALSITSSNSDSSTALKGCTGARSCKAPRLVLDVVVSHDGSSRAGVSTFCADLLEKWNRRDVRVSPKPTLEDV